MHQRAPGHSAEDTESTTRRWAALAGAVAGLAGLAVADLAAWLVAAQGSPVTAVGELIINVLPAPLVNFGKDTLGTADKPILLVIIIVGVLALCALAGRLELGGRYRGLAVFALVAVIGWIGVSAQAGVTLRAYVPTLVGLLVGYLILSSLIARLRPWRSKHAIDTPDSRARRGFLGALILVGALASVGAVAGRALIGAAGAVNEARSKIKLPTPATPGVVIPAAADLKIKDLSPYVTDVEDFYRIDTALQVPRIDQDEWSLTISGMVENEVTINFAELSALPLVEHVTTLTCVSNEVGGNLIGNAVWLGYPIRDLLARAKPRAGADMVLSTSDDGWTAGTPLTALTDPGREALLAIGMNGEALPLEHGFPVRMVVPGLYGYVSATKWVTSLKVTTFDADQGYWTPLGWSALGPIKIGSRIDVPGRGSADAGPVVIAGIAWAQHTGIAKVEVQIDQDPWVVAELADTTGPDTWRQWTYTWPATSGTHTVAVRATDTAGLVQTADSAPPAPDGATGYDTRQIKIR